MAGSIPTENLPKRPSEKTITPRQVLVRKAPDKEDPVPSTSSAYVDPEIETLPGEGISIDDIKEYVGKECLKPWKSDVKDNTVTFHMCDNVHSIPQYTVAINESVEITSFAYNWPIPHDHQVYSECKHSISTCGQIKELFNAIEKSMICKGLPRDSTVKYVAIDPNTDTTVPIPRTVIRRSIPHAPYPKQLKATVFYRSKDCNVLLETSKCCDPCNKLTKQLKKTKKSKGKASPAKNKAPLSACGPAKLRATVVAARFENKMLEERLEELQQKIVEHGVNVDQSLEDDILKMSAQNLEVTPHMKFFWQEQIKLLQSSSSGQRYHPQIIQFALSVHGKSPSAYRELRDSGALVLPSERVLRDYKNYFTPKAGINKENVDELQKVSTF